MNTDSERYYYYYRPTRRNEEKEKKYTRRPFDQPFLDLDDENIAAKKQLYIPRAVFDIDTKPHYTISKISAIQVEEEGEEKREEEKEGGRRGRATSRPRAVRRQGRNAFSR